jgi:hypothetical protein
MMRVVARTGDYTAATVPGGVFHIWHRNTTLAGVRHLEQAIHEACDPTHAQVPILLVVEPSAPPPPPDVRKAIADLMRTTAPHVLMTALVFEGTGFAAAMVRGIVTGLTLLARHPFPYKVFSNHTAAFNWMRTTTGRTETLESLQLAFESERRQYARAS